MLGWKKPVRVGDVVLVRRAGHDVIKRVSELQGERVVLRGDNSTESTDSRHYGPVLKSAIIGSIMIKLRFANAIEPPKPLKPYAVWLGRGLAGIMILMVLVHLFRIDTFVPLLDTVMPGGEGWANVFALKIILIELFALPFLLRMRLSPLAHILSGAFVVLAPLWWLLVTIWSWGLEESTGQLGQFIDVHAGVLLVLANAIWLGLSYFALYMLGYDKLAVHLKDIKRR